MKLKKLTLAAGILLAMAGGAAHAEDGGRPLPQHCPIGPSSSWPPSSSPSSPWA